MFHREIEDRLTKTSNYVCLVINNSAQPVFLIDLLHVEWFQVAQTVGEPHSVDAPSDVQLYIKAACQKQKPASVCSKI